MFTSELPASPREDHVLDVEGGDVGDYVEGVVKLKDQIVNLVSQKLLLLINIWSQLSVQIGFKKENSNEMATFWFQLPKTFINEPQEVEFETTKTLDALKLRIEQHQLRGSGWIFSGIKQAVLAIVKYRPLQGTSYIPTPQALRKSHAIINVQNQDNACFKWAILSALYPASSNAHRPSKYIAHSEKLNLEGLQYPMPLDKKQFQRFLDKNPMQHLNVFIYDEREGVLPFFSDPKDPQLAINLLFLHSRNGDSGHYVWIKDFGKLFHAITKHRNRKFFCMRCFSQFASPLHLDRHLQDCRILTSEDGMIKLRPHCKRCPDFTADCMECQNSASIKFDKFCTQQKIPAYIVCDFEAYQKRVVNDDSSSDEDEPECKRSRMDLGKITQHFPLSFALKIVIHPDYRHLDCFKGFSDHPIRMDTTQGEDSVALSHRFIKEVMFLGWCLMYVIKRNNRPMIWGPKEQEDFNRQTLCCICRENLDKDRVRHHDHLTGLFEGAAHSNCNLNFNLDNLQIPVIFHNFRGYDSKMVLPGLSLLSHEKVQSMRVLAQNSEQIKSLRIGPIKFVDSFQHLPSSLSTLVDNLVAECKVPGPDGKQKLDMKLVRSTFKNLMSEFGHLTDEQIALLLRKGVFPYAWLNSPEKLKEKNLPSQDAFFNDLVNEALSDEDYQHAQNMWRCFDMKSFHDYHDLYLKTDVLLLADVIENYQRISRHAYGLDPFWFISAPSMSFAAAMKLTKVELDLLTDMDMLHFIQKGIRGGLSYICKRECTANVPAMADKFDPNSPQVHLLYLDANNLYGFAMSKNLPTGGFKWIDHQDWPLCFTDATGGKDTYQEQMQALNVSPVNYILEVTAEFPLEVHDKMADYPFLPEVMTPPGGKHPKLVNHLGPRERYVVSLEMFLLAKSEGVVFNQVHRVLEFKQKAWLRPYIELNTRLRQASKNTFEQDYYKLLNNSIYGKLLEDVLKHTDFELFTSQNAKKYTSLHQKKPYMIKRKMVFYRCPNHEQQPHADACAKNRGCVVGLEKKKFKVTMNKPIYVGFSVLELSKLLMYEFYYHVLLPKFTTRMRLGFHDTDSFFLEITSNNLTQDLQELKDHLDTSNYPKDHPLYDAQNNKVPGKFKDEYPNRVITKFIGLRSKCYCLGFLNGCSCKKAKGTKRSVVQKTLDVQDYEDTLHNQTTVSRTVTSLRSSRQCIYTVRQSRVALCAKDDKRKIMANGVDTLPWFHRDVLNSV